ncbi:MAG: hypothetical protein ABIL45_09645 [candidate division WOR-3 bacterium]
MDNQFMGLFVILTILGFVIISQEMKKGKRTREWQNKRYGIKLYNERAKRKLEERRKKLKKEV